MADRPTRMAQPRARKALIAAGSASAAGLLLLVAAFFLTRDVAPRIGIRWNADERNRERLERQFQLAAGAGQPDGTWIYDLIDTSRRNIGAILTDTAVAEATNLDPVQLSPLPAAPRG